MAEGYLDTLPSAQENKQRPPEQREHRPADARAPMARKDTVALIDEAAGARELSPAVSIIIIVLLMIVAGVATYAWRRAQAPDTPDTNEERSEEAE
jgi:hypothetical protein